MKAIAVHPGKPNSIHLRDIPEPRVTDVADGRGVLVKVIRVGVDGTDKEINAAEYGAAPPGDDFLVTGHESFGQVVAVGPNVPTTIVPGHVRRRLRAPAGHVDLREDRPPGLHDRRRLLRARDQPPARVPDRVLRRGPPVRLPAARRASPTSAVLLEPTTVAEKGVNHAYEIQRRLKVWEPRNACVLGSGTVGLLTALVARLRGLELTVYSLPQKPNRNADLIEQLGGVYVSSQDATLAEASRRARAVRPDVRRDRLQPDRLGGRRGARQERRARARLDHRRRPQGRDQLRPDQPGLRARQQGHGRHRQRGAERLPAAASTTSSRPRRSIPGWLGQLLTTPIQGLENYEEMIRAADREPRRDQGLRRGRRERASDDARAPARSSRHDPCLRRRHRRRPAPRQGRRRRRPRGAGLRRRSALYFTTPAARRSLLDPPPRARRPRGRLGVDDRRERRERRERDDARTRRPAARLRAGLRSSEPARISAVDRATGEVGDASSTRSPGFPLNSPNDVVVKRDGTIWFTDPSYGFLQGFRPRAAARRLRLPLRPARGPAHRRRLDFDKPNGLAFSPDERILYVGDSGANHEPGSFDPRRPAPHPCLRRRRGSGSRTIGCSRSRRPGFPDGIKVDADGRVYASAFSGVQVFDPAGELLGEIHLPGAVNFTFGGARSQRPLHHDRRGRLGRRPQRERSVTAMAVGAHPQDHRRRGRRRRDRRGARASRTTGVTAW